MILSLGTLTVPAPHVATVRQMITALAAQTRTESGCLSYRVSEDLETPGMFLINERWQDMAAMQAHLALPGVGEAVAAVQGLGVTDLSITAWETGTETQIM